ncbi:MAG: nuclear transport factor 2 family protein [Chthoniobacterales bacterium]
MSKNSQPEKSPRFSAWFVIVIFIALGLGGAGEHLWKVSRDEGPDSASIHEFLNHYFQTWSTKDMAGYGACFDPTAMIYFIRDGQVLLRQGKPDFIAGQADVLKAETQPIEEQAENIDILVDNDVAYARVRWKMTKGTVTKHGYDHFVLLHTKGGWQITSLTFYEIPKEN